MSRYVDLDGLSWDGKPIASKIQEVKTQYGYMQGITVGWLWGDNVPHIDLAEHDAKVRAEGELIGITRVLDVLEHLDVQKLELVKDALYEQDFKELKEQKE